MGLLHGTKSHRKGNSRLHQASIVHFYQQQRCCQQCLGYFCRPQKLYNINNVWKREGFTSALCHWFKVLLRNFSSSSFIDLPKEPIWSSKVYSKVLFSTTLYVAYLTYWHDLTQLWTKSKCMTRTYHPRIILAKCEPVRILFPQTTQPLLYVNNPLLEGYKVTAIAFMCTMVWIWLPSLYHLDK